MSRGPLIVAATALGLVLIIVWWLLRDAPTPERPPTFVARALRPTRPRVPLVAPAPERELPDLVDPAREPERAVPVAGSLSVDARGHFVPTPDARTFFDAFLTALDGEPADAVRSRLVREINAQLPAAPARDAVDLLERYMRYRDRAELLEASVKDPAARFDELRAMRRQILGEYAAEELFGAEEAAEAEALRRAGVAADPSLSPEEAAAALEAAQGRLPPEVQRDRAAAAAALRLQRELEQRRREAPLDEDLYAERVERFGREKADQLADIDRARAEWQERLDEYRIARDEILHNASLSPQGRAAAIEKLLENFNSIERARIKALESVEAGQ